MTGWRSVSVSVKKDLTGKVGGSFSFQFPTLRHTRKRLSVYLQQPETVENSFTTTPRGHPNLFRDHHRFSLFSSRPRFVCLFNSLVTDYSDDRLNCKFRDTVWCTLHLRRPHLPLVSTREHTVRTSLLTSHTPGAFVSPLQPLRLSILSHHLSSEYKNLFLV